MASWLFLGKGRPPLHRHLIHPRMETGRNRFASYVPEMLSDYLVGRWPDRKN